MCGYDKAGRSVVKVRLRGGETRQTRDRSCVLCLVWSQKAKEAGTEKNGEIGENEEGEVGKRLRRVGHVRQSAGRLHPVGERLRPLTGPTGSRRSESDHHSSFMLPRDCHCTGPSGKRVPRQTLQCLFFTKYCLFGSLFWPTRRISIAFARVR